LEPNKTKEDYKGDTIIDNKAYKDMISGLNRKFWVLVIEGGISYREVSKFTSDEILEAYSALQIFEEEKKDEIESQK